MKKWHYTAASHLYSFKWPTEVLKWKNIQRFPSNLQMCFCLFCFCFTLSPLCIVSRRSRMLFELELHHAHQVVTWSRRWSFDFRDVFDFYFVSSGSFMTAKQFKEDWTWTWNLKSKSKFSFRSLGCYSLQHRLAE